MTGGLDRLWTRAVAMVAAVVLVVGLAGLRAEGASAPTPRTAPPIAGAPVRVASLSPQPHGRIYPGLVEVFRAPGGQRGAVATWDNGILHVEGRYVAKDIGVVVWSNDSRFVFFGTSVPTTEPEPFYALRASGGEPFRLGANSDPGQLVPAGADSVAFDDHGALGVANAVSPHIVLRTAIPLSPRHTVRDPYYDSKFLLSKNMRYVAVLSPQDRVTIYVLRQGETHPGKPAPVARQFAIPGKVSDARYEWGAWNQRSQEFICAVQTAAGLPRLEVWSAKSGAISRVGGAFDANHAGEYLILGWLNRDPNAFLVNFVKLPAYEHEVQSKYLAGWTNGGADLLWIGGYGGSLSASQATVSFTFSSSPTGQELPWKAVLGWS